MVYILTTDKLFLLLAICSTHTSLFKSQFSNKNIPKTPKILRNRVRVLAQSKPDSTDFKMQKNPLSAEKIPRSLDFTTDLRTRPVNTKKRFKFTFNKYPIFLGKCHKISILPIKINLYSEHHFFYYILKPLRHFNIVV